MRNFYKNTKKFWQQWAYNLSGLFFDYLPKFMPKNLLYLILIAIPALIGYWLGGIRGIWTAFWIVIWGLAIFFLGAYLWFSKDENLLVKTVKKIRRKKDKNNNKAMKQ